MILRKTIADPKAVKRMDLSHIPFNLAQNPPKCVVGKIWRVLKECSNLRSDRERSSVILAKNACESSEPSVVKPPFSGFELPLKDIDLILQSTRIHIPF